MEPTDGAVNAKYPTWRPDYLCKWCLSYVGQRRQFCSADCAAQFKLCQKRRDQRQDLNISVDYYGNVKLSIQGLPISSTDELPATKPFPGSNGLIGRRGRRRKRCRNCAKLLSDDTEDEFCDDRCETMETERSKKEFVNIFQQKEVAERRRIRKWLTDAQDQYTKQEGDGDLLGSYTSRSGGPSHSFRSSHHLIAEKFHLRKDEAITGGHVKLNPTPLRRGPARQEKQSMESDKRQLMVDLKWIPKFFG